MYRIVILVFACFLGGFLSVANAQGINSIEACKQNPKSDECFKACIDAEYSFASCLNFRSPLPSPPIDNHELGNVTKPLTTWFDNGAKWRWSGGIWGQTPASRFLEQQRIVDLQQYRQYLNRPPVM